MLAAAIIRAMMEAVSTTKTPVNFQTTTAQQPRRQPSLCMYVLSSGDVSEPTL
jgi:hypothetical protein